MELIAVNAVSKPKRTIKAGREYIVAKASMIVPGVLNGSDGPIYYSPKENARSASAWNGMPLVLYHPYLNGRPVSARNPDVLERSQLGQVFYSYADGGGKLQAEAWFDREMTERVDNLNGTDVLPRLLRGEKIELSTGLDLDKKPAPRGSVHNSKSYLFSAHNYRPDHLAVLPDQRGACSIADGCGINNQTNEESMNDKTLWQRFGERLGMFGNKPTVNASGYGTCEDCGAPLNADGVCEACAAKKQPPAPPAKKPPTSNRGANDMNALKDAERAALVQYITANCSCWNGEDDAEILNEFTDERLLALKKSTAEGKRNKELVANLAKPVKIGDHEVALDLTKGTLVANMVGCDPDDSDDDDGAAPPKKGKKPPMTTTNQRNDKPVPMEKLLEGALPEDRATWNHAQRLVRDHRKHMVEAIVANMGGDEETAATFNKMDIEDIEKLFNKLPKSKGKRGEQRGEAVSYLGAGARVTYNRVDEDDDVAEPNFDDAPEPPVWNQEAFAEPKQQKAARRR